MTKFVDWWLIKIVFEKKPKKISIVYFRQLFYKNCQIITKTQLINIIFFKIEKSILFFIYFNENKIWALKKKMKHYYVWSFMRIILTIMIIKLSKIM